MEELRDALILEWALRYSLSYPHSLIRGFPHLQQKLILRHFSKPAPGDDSSIVGLLITALGALNNALLPTHKKAVIAIWMLAFLCLPKKPAFWVVVQGFRRGLVVSWPKFRFS
jgi:hypothetical protein